jgi:hypothetical protein
MLRTACLFAPVLSLAIAPQALAQSAGGGHVLGAFVGVTDRSDADFTIGAEYEYLFTSQLSLGGIVEYTPDAYGPSSATVTLATVNLRPIPRLKFTGGAGVEFNDFNDRFRARVGAGYDVIDGPVNVTPRVAVDFGDGDESLVFGATVSRRF